MLFIHVHVFMYPIFDYTYRYLWMIILWPPIFLSFTCGFTWCWHKSYKCACILMIFVFILPIFIYFHDYFMNYSLTPYFSIFYVRFHTKYDYLNAREIPFCPNVPVMSHKVPKMSPDFSDFPCFWPKIPCFCPKMAIFCLFSPILR